MATTQSSGPFHSPQFSVRRTSAPAPTTHLVDQRLRRSVESPQLLAAVEVLLPLAREKYRELRGPRSSSCDPRTAEIMKSKAEAWFLGIILAEDALDRIKPYGNVLYRFFQQCERRIRAKKAVQG